MMVLKSLKNVPVLNEIFLALEHSKDSTIGTWRGEAATVSSNMFVGLLLVQLGVLSG